MKKVARHLSIVIAALVLTTFCISIVYAAGADEKAKEILGKTYKKYTDLFKKSGGEVKSLAARITVKGGGEVPMGDSGEMPMNVDAALEIYFAQPHNLYVALSGNLGNATVAVTGKEKKVATVVLPDTKQFARIDIPEEVVKKTEIDETEKPPDMEELFKEMVLSYQGTGETKLGKAHKIMLKPKDPSEGGVVTVYILDGKWDPVRLDLSVEEKANVTVEFEKLELNKNIPDKQFVPDTSGFTEITKDQLATVVMMQLMNAMMQTGGTE